MSNPIVVINVSTQTAPAPSTLQQTGAIISQGGTTLAVGTYGLLTQMADLTAILTPGAAITSLTWTSGVVTATTAAPHTIPNGDALSLVITGAVPTAYNGSYICTATGASTFTYPLVSNPGTETTPGTWIPANENQVIADYTTYLAQGTRVATYVLELGEGNAAQGVTALSTFITTTSPQMFYSYLVPRYWRTEPTFATFAATFTALNAKTYFHIAVTAASSTYTPFLTYKSCICTMEAPGIPATENDAAAVFALTLAYAPSSGNKVTLLLYSYLFGVTAYPTVGNAAAIATVAAAYVNYVGTGSEGGLSNMILQGGTTMDGKSWNYWFAADWAQINLDLNLSNEIINGSNNPLQPLYYNQQGINRLLARAQQTLTNGATYGLFLSTPKNPITVTAQSFSTYVLANPTAYSAGTYGGLAAIVIPQTGFNGLVFQLQISNFTNG